MKSFIYILLTSLTFLVVGCQNESEEIRLINQAERLFDAYPDSVITTLDSIPLPEEMSPRLIARWCMLYARAADKIEDEMPYTNQLEIALKYYQKKKMREEEAEIGLYLGRSYVEDKEYEKAMRAYSDALEVALAIKNYNRAGYICSYMGDLYELDDRYVLAAKKYKESGRYFRLAGNMKSYVRSFVNEGRSYMDVDSNYLALTILKRAEVIIDSLRVDEVRNYVYNGLGNIFNVLEKYDLAEKYLLKSIKEDSSDTASDYLTLSDLEQKRGNLEQAENYLQKANSVSIDNDFVPATIAYHYYKINKETLKHFLMNSDIRWNDAGSGEWHMRRWCTALIIICLMAGWIALWQEEKVLSVSTAFVETKKAALTFDDGPSPLYTERLLDGLKERGVVATFFVTGENAQSCPDLIRREKADGHLIGNHTYSHIQLTSDNKEVFREELVKTNEILEAITGENVTYIRPPYGSWDKSLEQDLNMFPVLWNVDPLDWCTPDAGLVMSRVLQQVEDGDIILLHDYYDTSVTAALMIVDEMKKQGYEFVTVEEILFD